MKDKIIQKILKMLAGAVLKKRKPNVVAITGSIGKTTTREAITKVLISTNLKVRSSQKNYNTEVGVPLTILGCQIDYSRNKILQAWGVLYYWSQAMFFDKNYPEILVLEMGADKPGDIKYFCDFVPITVGVLTDIGISHLENFKTRQNLATEKGYLLRSIKNKGIAIYNYDNKLVREVGKKISINKISYGLEKEAEMRATDIINKVEVGEKNRKIAGVSFKLNYQGKVLPVRLENCVGRGAIYSCLAAFSVGQYFGLNLIEIIERLKDFESCPGRMTLLKGKRNSVIVDDSYNSAPDSLNSALELVGNFKAERKIVVLGDMLELGDREEKAHRNIGKVVKENKIDLFITVGDRMKLAKEEFDKSNSGKSINFNNPVIAGEFVEDSLQAGDLILVKGSQGMRMEKVTEKILDNFEDGNKKLVRQDKIWKKIPYKKP